MAPTCRPFWEATHSLIHLFNKHLLPCPQQHTRGSEAPGAPSQFGARPSEREEGPTPRSLPWNSTVATPVSSDKACYREQGRQWINPDLTSTKLQVTNQVQKEIYNTSPALQAGCLGAGMLATWAACLPFPRRCSCPLPTAGCAACPLPPHPRQCHLSPPHRRQFRLSPPSPPWAVPPAPSPLRAVPPVPSPLRAVLPVPSPLWAVPPVPYQALEGPLTANASSWLWIFLPLSNLEDRQAEMRRHILGPACNIPKATAALVPPPQCP